MVQKMKKKKKIINNIQNSNAIQNTQKNKQKQNNILNSITNNKNAPQKKNVACRTLYTACNKTNNLKNSIQTVRCTIRINGIQHAPIIDKNKKYNTKK